VSAFTPYERRWIARSPRVAAVPPPRRPFDRDRALRAFERVIKRAYFNADWAQAELPPLLEREEATFWLYAMSAVDTAYRALPAPSHGDAREHFESVRAAARAAMRELDVSREPDRDEIARRLAVMARPAWGEGSYREACIALAGLLELPALLDLIIDESNEAAAAQIVRDERARRGRPEYQTWLRTTTGAAFEATPGPSDAPEPCATPATPFAEIRKDRRRRDATGVTLRTSLHRSLAAGFADYVAPYLDDAQFAAARALVRAAVDRALRREPFDEGAFAFHLAASLHLTDDVEAIAAAVLRDANAAWNALFPRAIVYGLRTPEAIVRESRRLGLRLTDPPAVREWLATTGTDGIEYALEQIAAHAEEPTADAFVEALAALDAPHVPAVLLRATAVPLLYVPARAALEADLDRALPVLAAEAHRKSALGETAREILQRFARRGHAGAADALHAELRR
jgi:hypothetical protein